MKAKYLTLVLLLFSTTLIYSQDQEHLEEYMQVLVVYKGGKTIVTELLPTGEIKEVKLKSVSNGFGFSADKVALVQIEIQNTLNNLAKEGWQLINISNLQSGTLITTSYYMKRNLL
ncbi:MAG: hypothetical protein AAGC47_16325 [Bacteroidota bacterium]